MGHPQKNNPDESGQRGIRIQKYAASCGAGSRRKCDELAAQGRLKINGEQASHGSRVFPGDRVELDGKILVPLEKEYHLLNKPMGVICTNRREGKKKRAIDFIEGAEEKGLFTVGRLDVGTSGLIIITNDGELANGLAHPSMGVEKEYIVHVRGDFTELDAQRLERGVDIGETRNARSMVKRTKRVETGAQGTGTKVWLVVHEGRFHVVRRMMESLGKDVISLTRIRVGHITLGKLRPGESRPLTRRD
ncbi:MAG: pseudouridine synthase, partial [Candidatus Thermoplasmatota archaeon]|nr:pseudouridine synthase [Candidatus Thermoplasmatota archaeon]